MTLDSGSLLLDLVTTRFISSVELGPGALRNRQLKSVMHHPKISRLRRGPYLTPLYVCGTLSYYMKFSSRFIEDTIFQL